MSDTLTQEFKPILTTFKGHHRNSANSITSESQSIVNLYGQVTDEDQLDKAFNEALKQFEGNYML